MRYFRRPLPLLFLLFIISALFAVQADEDVMDEASALAMLGELNAWRIEQDLTPLRIDPTLQAMADFQADYLLSLNEIPGGAAVHLGWNGEGPKDRARFPRFDWPHYLLPEQTLIGEIAAVNSPEGALRFWQTSPPHRTTVTNAVYREVGIVAYPHDFGYLYVAVFGTRPNVLPTLYEPTTDRLFLTNELSPYAKRADLISRVKRYRLFDDFGRPIGDWQLWQRTVQLPEGLDERVFVLYSDNNVEVMSLVSLTDDRVILPDNMLDILDDGGAPPAPTATPIPPTPTPAIVGPDLTLVYDNEALTLINTSDRALNLGTLVLSNDDVRLPFTWWSAVVDIPIYQFPAGDCVQAWSIEQGSQPVVPESCHVLRSGRSNLASDALFWTRGEFEVRQGDTLVATCPIGPAECAVELP